MNKNVLLLFIILGPTLQAEVPIADSPALSRRAGIQGRVQLELDEQLGASKYEIELQDAKRKKTPFVFSSKTPRFDVHVPVGKYLLRGRVLDPRKLESPWSAPEEVMVTATVQQKVPPPVLLPVLAEAPGEISWQSVPDVTATVTLEHQRLMASDWKTIDKGEQIEGGSWKTNAELIAGRYRWTVFFEDEVFGKSEPNNTVFLVKPKAADLAPELLPVLNSLGL